MLSRAEVVPHVARELLGGCAERCCDAVCNASVTPAAYVSGSALVCTSAADTRAPSGTWRSSWAPTGASTRRMACTWSSSRSWTQRQSVYSQIRRGPPAHHSTVLISSKDGSAPLGQSPNLPPDCLSNPFDCPHKGPPIEGPTICEFVTVCPSVCSAFQM